MHLRSLNYQSDGKLHIFTTNNRKKTAENFRQFFCTINYLTIIEAYGSSLGLPLLLLHDQSRVADCQK